MRLRWPPSRVIFTRVGSFDFGSSSITFEMWIGAGWCVTPPTSPARWASRTERGRWCRVVMLRPSTNTRCLFGSTVSTVPVLPLSLPDMTFTVSPLRILKPAMALKHLRRQRDDLHEVAVAQLARHRPEDAGAARVVGGIDDHCGVLVEGDVGAVLAAELLLGPDDDGRHDLALLDVAVRDRLLHRGDYRVADTGVAARRAPPHADAQDLARAGVVGHAKPCLGLDHLSSSGRRADGLIYRDLSSTSTSRQRLVRDSGRDSTTRTRSPSFASLRSSCTWSLLEDRTIFL